MAQPSNPEIALAVIERFEAQSSEFESMKTRWDEIANYIQPRTQVTSKTTPPDFSGPAQLFTTKAIRAKDTLTRGMVSMMVPAQSPWFTYDAPAHLRSNDKVKAWFSQCTEIIQAEMQNSNFYTEVHEWLDTWAGFGPASMQVEEGKRSLYNFTNLGIGSFAIAENDEGFVDTVWICKPYTVRQLVQKFGIKNVSPKSREAYEKDNGKNRNQPVEVIHEIRPRAESEYEPGKMGKANMPIASCYVEKAHNHLLREGGYQEMPNLVGRFQKSDDTPYGWSPSWYVLPDSRQLNFLEKMLDALAEKAAFPPMIAPVSMEGLATLDVRASGVTYVEDLAEAGILKEWQTAGRYDIGKDRVLLKEQAIAEGYFSDVFRMFADYEGPQMTAREVIERQSEKIYQFSSSVTRLTMEFFNPLLQRVWAIAVRSGRLPRPPEEAFEQGADGQAYLPEPELTYKSRIALAIKQIENVGFLQTLDTIIPLLDHDPSILDRFDLDVAIADMSRNNNVPARWIRPDDVVAEIRQARAAQMEAMQRAEQAKLGSETARNLGQAMPAAA